MFYHRTVKLALLEKNLSMFHHWTNQSNSVVLTKKKKMSSVLPLDELETYWSLGTSSEPGKEI